MQILPKARPFFPLFHAPTLYEKITSAKLQALKITFFAHIKKTKIKQQELSISE